MADSSSFQIDPKEYQILVVDDTPTNLKVVINYLRTYGFKLLMADDGESCLKQVKIRHPDLILLDVMMPGMDGFEVCRILQADEMTRQIPIIFMTALSNEADKVKGFEVGAVDYITKPIQQMEVLARVNTHLRIQRQARELQQANQKLIQLNADKDKFFSIVAHDLKGPFMPLLGNAELLTEMGDVLPPAEVKQLGAAIQRTGRNVFSLLENLLAWARLQMGRMEYSPQLLDMSDIAIKNVELLSGNAAIKQIDLRNEVKAETWVYADENMLDTVIRNLINNALKFTPQGGQVTIAAQLGIRNWELGVDSFVIPNSSLLIPNYIEVSVADTGGGMSEETRQKLFKLDQHVTTVGTGHETGTGLGLIICQEMVIKSGGRIWVESEVGRGTTVHFTVQSNGR